MNNVIMSVIFSQCSLTRSVVASLWPCFCGGDGENEKIKRLKGLSIFGGRAPY